MLHLLYALYFYYIFISHVARHFVEKYQKAKQLVKSKKKSGKQKDKFWKKVKLLNIYIHIFLSINRWIRECSFPSG